MREGSNSSSTETKKASMSTWKKVLISSRRQRLSASFRRKFSRCGLFRYYFVFQFIERERQRVKTLAIRRMNVGYQPIPDLRQGFGNELALYDVLRRAENGMNPNGPSGVVVTLLSHAL